MSDPANEHIDKLIAWVEAAQDAGMSPPEAAQALGAAVGFLVKGASLVAPDDKLRATAVQMLIDEMLSGVMGVADCVVFQTKVQVVQEPDEGKVH